MPDQIIQYTEEMVGAGHPTKSDTLNRALLVQHNSDGTHKENSRLTGEVAQIVSYQTGASATGTTSIPHDDTIPQKTEGNQFMSLSITPKAATNKLKITVTFNWAHSSAGAFLALALFKDADADAIAVATGSQAASSGGYPNSTALVHNMTAGGTSPITFYVRAGCDSGATLTFNGRAGSRTYGGAIASGITIEEYVA